MKTRRHHNNKGLRQIKNGTTAKDIQHIIRRLKKKGLLKEKN